MKIVLTVNAAWNALNFRRPVIEALLSQGHNVTILAPVDHAADQLRALGCDVVNLEMDVQGLSPRKDARLIGHFRHHFAALKPDVVLSYTVKNNIFGAIAAKRLNIPFLPNISGLGTAFLSGGALRLVVENLYRFAFHGLPILFFQNPDDKDLFVQRGLAQSQQSRLLAGSGVDLDHFTSAPMPVHSKTVFLMISRLLRDKGAVEFVEAAKIIRSKHENVHFQMLGSVNAANRSALGVDDLERWTSEGIIEHLGEHADVRPFIRQADCIVLPSYREGAPRTLIEAASMARPLIATDVPGCRHVVDHERTGLLCKPRDPVSLARSCTEFLSFSRDRRRRMGCEGRRKMHREYCQSFVIKAYLQAIDEVTPNLSGLSSAPSLKLRA